MDNYVVVPVGEHVLPQSYTLDQNVNNEENSNPELILAFINTHVMERKKLIQ